MQDEDFKTFGIITSHQKKAKKQNLGNSSDKEILSDKQINSRPNNNLNVAAKVYVNFAVPNALPVLGAISKFFSCDFCMFQMFYVFTIVLVL